MTITLGDSSGFKSTSYNVIYKWSTTSITSCPSSTDGWSSLAITTSGTSGSNTATITNSVGTGNGKIYVCPSPSAGIIDSWNNSTTYSNTTPVSASLYLKSSGLRGYASDIVNSYDEQNTTSVTTTGGESITQVSELGLMQDSFGNIRYYGLDPNNYVTFNGEEAGWRIIGVFNVEDENGNTEQRIKLIRTNAIGTYAYDNKTSGIGSSTASSGSNDWSDSRLMMLLNPPEKTLMLRASNSSIYTLTPGLYWDSGSGSCYSGSSQGTTTCDFTSTGMTEEGKAMIGQAKYSLLGSSTNSGLYADDYYNKEQTTGTSGSSGSHATSWTGYVGIMYPSDHAYASDLSVCTYVGYYYYADTTNCTGTNWILQGNVVSGSTSKVHTWTISPRSSDAYRAFFISSVGDVDYNRVYTAYGVRPVVYLSSSVGIIDGSGTSGDPYILETNDMYKFTGTYDDSTGIGGGAILPSSGYFQAGKTVNTQCLGFSTGYEVTGKTITVINANTGEAIDYTNSCILDEDAYSGSPVYICDISFTMPSAPVNLTCNVDGYYNASM